MKRTLSVALCFTILMAAYSGVASEKQNKSQKGSGTIANSQERVELREGCRTCTGSGTTKGSSTYNHEQVDCLYRGVKKGEIYCDVFSRETLGQGKGKQMLVTGLFGAIGAAFLDSKEIAFRDALQRSFRFIYVSGDDNRLILAPSDKKLSGDFIVTTNKDIPVQIIQGLPGYMKNTIFGASAVGYTDGLYTFKTKDSEYPLLFVSKEFVVVFDKDENILCSGRGILKAANKKLSLVCDSDFARALDRVTPLSKGKFHSLKLQNK